MQNGARKDVTEGNIGVPRFRKGGETRAKRAPSLHAGDEHGPERARDTSGTLGDPQARTLRQARRACAPRIPVATMTHDAAHAPTKSRTHLSIGACGRECAAETREHERQPNIRDRRTSRRAGRARQRSHALGSGTLFRPVRVRASAGAFYAQMPSQARGACDLRPSGLNQRHKKRRLRGAQNTPVPRARARPLRNPVDAHRLPPRRTRAGPARIELGHVCSTSPGGDVPARFFAAATPPSATRRAPDHPKRGEACARRRARRSLEHGRRSMLRKAPHGADQNELHRLRSGRRCGWPWYSMVSSFRRFCTSGAAA